MITEFHKENMRKHIAYLERGSKFLKARFDMDHYDDSSAPSYLLTNCGTIGCSLGHAPFSIGIPKGTDEYWDKYGLRIFGFSLSSDERDYLFSSHWSTVNNTPEAAAARMKMVLINGMPKRWDFTEEYAHPIVIEEEILTLERV